jgi:branched-chain amino acid transport system ATP-binding protein
VLEVRDLNVSYGDAQALWDINLVIAAGEVISVVGSNGAGKSTLVNSLVGLLRPKSGQILIGDTDITRLPPHAVIGEGIAIVPEGRRIFPGMNVQENLDLGCYRKASRAHREDTLDWVYSLFPILKDRPTQMAGSFSGGEQQMLAIARALMSRPRLLLLDEPSLGLAPQIVDTIFDVIVEINNNGVTVCLVEQNVLQALELSTRGYLIEEGRIALEGTPDELIGNEHVRRACLGV